MALILLHSFRLAFVSYLFLFIFAASAMAQTRIYYSELFKLPVQEKTKYFREFTETDSGAVVVEMCNDTLMAKGVISPLRSVTLMNDFAHFVRSLGNPYQSKHEFTAMRADIDYYQHGIKRSKFVAHLGKVLYAQQWSKNGLPLLVNGTGAEDYMEKESHFHQSFKDSLLVEMYEVRHAEGDTLYYTYDSMAAPKEGYQQFTEDLVKILKYPGFARLMGKQGVVYVQFIIDKEGRLGEVKPLSHEGFNLEKKAIDKLVKMPKWNPAIFRGRPVKMKFTIPIRFRLT